MFAISNKIAQNFAIMPKGLAMDKRLQLNHLIADPIETPAGLLVSSRSFDALVKAEARKMAAQGNNRSAFFSRIALANNMIAYGAREKPVGTPSFEILRECAKKSVIDKIIIKARVDQQKRVWQKSLSGKQVGFQVVHERHDDPDFKGSKEIDVRCREVEELLSNPTPVDFIDIYPHRIRPHQRLKDLVAILTQAELIIDRKVVRRYKRRDGKGYACFHWLPGDTIKNVDEAVRDWAQKNEPDKKIGRYTFEKMSYATGFDVAQAAFVQMVDGMITEAYAEDEISVHISNPSDELNRWGYGTSRLELSLDITTTLLYAWNYNKEMFKTNYPEQVLAVIGDYDKDGLTAFKQQILGEGGIGQNWRLPVIPFSSKEEAQLQAIKLRESPKDMLFDNLFRIMCMLKAAAYGAAPQTLNLQMDSGGGTSLFGHNPSEEIEFSKEHGLMPSLTDMCEWWTDALVKPRYDDLKLILVGLEPEDEKQAVDLRTSRVSKWVTKNEARMEEGLEPIGDVNDDGNPWNYPADVPIANYINTFSMLGQQDQGDDEGEDDQDDDQDQDGQEQVQKSMRDDVKFLQITLEK